MASMNLKFPQHQRQLLLIFYIPFTTGSIARSSSESQLIPNSIPRVVLYGRYKDLIFKYLSAIVGKYDDELADRMLHFLMKYLIEMELRGHIKVTILRNGRKTNAMVRLVGMRIKYKELYDACFKPAVFIGNLQYSHFDHITRSVRTNIFNDSPIHISLKHMAKLSKEAWVVRVTVDDMEVIKIYIKNKWGMGSIKELLECLEGIMDGINYSSSKELKNFVISELNIILQIHYLLELNGETVYINFTSDFRGRMYSKSSIGYTYNKFARFCLEPISPYERSIKYQHLCDINNLVG